MGMNRFGERFERYLENEIIIDFKTCAYFFCMAFFYCCYRISQGSFQASIVFLFEMIVDAYVVGYIQVYLFRNFDEAPGIGRREAAGLLVCSLIHGLAAHLLGWFDGKRKAAVWFTLFMAVCYLTLYVCNRIRRRVDTEKLNRMLAEFKKEEHRHGEK